jgi:hypothetical protein
LADLLHWPQFVWVAAFLLYAIDCLRLVQPGRMLLVESGGGRLTPVLARLPFEFRQRELYWVGLMRPWRGVFVARWPDSASVAEPTLLRDGLAPLRVISSVNAAALFVVAPLLTSGFGLVLAVLLVAPLVYVGTAVASVWLVRSRARLHLSRGQIASLIADAWLCAPYSANWTQRLCRVQPVVDIDEAWLARHADHEAHETFLRALAERRKLRDEELQ